MSEKRKKDEKTGEHVLIFLATPCFPRRRRTYLDWHIKDSRLPPLLGEGQS